MSQMTIGKRITLAFGVIIALLFILVVAMKFGINGIVSNAEQVIEGSELDRNLAQAEIDHLNWVSAVSRLFTDTNTRELKVQKDDRKCGFGQWLYGEGRKEAEIFIPETSKLLKKIEAAHKRLHASAIKIQDADNAKTIYAQETVSALTEVQGIIAQLRKLAKEKNIMNEEIMIDSAKKTELFSLIIGLLAIFVCILLSFLTSRNIIKVLKDVAGRLGVGAHQIAAASSQITSSSQSLANGASSQAASLEETSASLEEMAAMSSQNSDNAGQADSLMKEAAQVITGADDSMGKLTVSMQEISSASAETQNIVKTIDEIAFQTNLLALNAAVEAARAGEAGAGFAVVADEVRNLAMRAAEAAKNTSTLIDGTVAKINTGENLLNETSDKFQTTTEAVKKVSSLIGEIATASNEQNQGVSQVNSAVVEIDSVTQDTAANAEESASASEELNSQAVIMEEIVTELQILVGQTGSKIKRLDKTPRRPIVKEKQTPSTISPPRQKVVKALPVSPTPVKKKKVVPEEIIPMGEDEFEDF